MTDLPLVYKIILEKWYFSRSGHWNAIHNDKENPILPVNVPEAVSGGSPGSGPDDMKKSPEKTSVPNKHRDGFLQLCPEPAGTVPVNQTPRKFGI